ncbi:MAG: hypothetical protein WKF79_00855 [Nocardioides sp.]
MRGSPGVLALSRAAVYVDGGDVGFTAEAADSGESGKWNAESGTRAGRAADREARTYLGTRDAGRG